MMLGDSEIYYGKIRNKKDVFLIYIISITSKGDAFGKLISAPL